MNILITGAFGNLGQMCIRQALSDGFNVVCLDRDTRQNRKYSRKYRSRVTTLLGDIRDDGVLASALSGVDAVLHNAAILPPISEAKPELSYAVNVEASARLINRMRKMNPMPVLVYPSSVTVFGIPKTFSNLARANDPTFSTDRYSSHKVEVERILHESKIPWVILRIGVAVDERTLRTDATTFSTLLSVHPLHPLEYVHPKDAALAMCNAAVCPDAIGRILLIGGGPTCQLTHAQFLNAAFSAVGLKVPDGVRKKERYYTHWMDTTESEHLLHYQRYPFSDYVQQLHRKLRVYRWLIRPHRFWVQPLLHPVFRALMLFFCRR